MCIFFDIDSVVMNALIEVTRHTKKQELSFGEIVLYGRAAARLFREKTGKDTALLFSEEYQVSMMECYSQYLDVDAYINRGVFKLRDNVPLPEIEDLFRWTLDADLLDALMSPEAIGILGRQTAE